jgi:hypothetical protein
MNEAWVCPKCGNVWAWHISGCQRCNDSDAKPTVDAEDKKLLNDLYCAIWSEACYDPTTEATGNFCKGLVDKIQRLNEKLKFKR